MLIRSGNAATFPVEFPSGHPDGNITVKVLAEDGSIMDTTSLVVPADAVSINIPVSATLNTLGVGVTNGYRDLLWSYTVSGAVVNGEQRYSLEARVPFGVSPDGVRNKLGVNADDLSDSDVELMRAYLAFQGIVGAQNLTSIVSDLAVRDAIEALAALSLLPTMMARVAIKESSGTDLFQRDKTDWLGMTIYLQAFVTAGVLVVNPAFDVTGDFGSLLVLATPGTDAITGV